jgi:hypothetical protein
VRILPENWRPSHEGHLLGEVDVDTGCTTGEPLAMSKTTLVVFDGQHNASVVAYRAY